MLLLKSSNMIDFNTRYVFLNVQGNTLCKVSHIFQTFSKLVLLKALIGQFHSKDKQYNLAKMRDKDRKLFLFAIHGIACFSPNEVKFQKI